MVEKEKLGYKSIIKNEGKKMLGNMMECNGIKLGKCFIF